MLAQLQDTEGAEVSAWSETIDALAGYLPNLLGALAVLVFGWLFALVLARLVGAALRGDGMRRLMRRISGQEEPGDVDVRGLSVRGVFYVLMLFVLVAFFQVLGLTVVTEPLNSALSQLTAFAPRLVAAAFLLLLAWLLAASARLVVTRALTSTRLDARLGEQVKDDGTDAVPLSRTLGDTVYWLVLLLFLPAVLDSLRLEGLLGPIQGMLAQVLGYAPNVLGAAVLLLVGWFFARILRRVVTSLVSSAGVDKLTARVGLDRVLGSQSLSAVLGLVVYVLVLIPVLVAALNALELEAVSSPVSEMLNRLLGVLPSVFGALVILAFAFVAGKLVSTLVANLLGALGFDLILARLGVAAEPSEEAVEPRRRPSEIAGALVLLAILLFAGMEACALVGFESLSNLIARLTVFGGQILLGLVVLALGILLAKTVHGKLSTSRVPNAGLLALTARVAILVVAATMAVEQVGIGREVTSIILAALLGALAIAFALAFGLGARDSAGRLVDDWIERVSARRSSTG